MCETFFRNFVTFTCMSKQTLTWKAVTELHEDGGRHWHVILKFGRPYRGTNVRVFDIDGVHPNIQVYVSYLLYLVVSLLTQLD
jgi:hypothetical protein